MMYLKKASKMALLALILMLSTSLALTGIHTIAFGSQSGRASLELQELSLPVGDDPVCDDLVLSPGTIELSYDDGVPETSWAWVTGARYAVRFTPTASGQLVECRFYIYADPACIKVHVMDASKIDRITPFTRTPTSTGWFHVDLSGYALSVTSGDDFYIAMEYTIDYVPYLGTDTSSPDGRSWSSYDGSSWDLRADRDYMIRAYVETEVGDPDIRVEPSSLNFEYTPSSSVEPMIEVSIAGGGAITCAVDFTELALNLDGDYTEVSSPGCDLMFETGKPILPAKSFFVLLPPGTTIESFTVTSCDKVALEGKYSVQLAPPPSTTGHASSDAYAGASPELYPEQVFRIGGIHKFRGYRLLDVTCFGAQYDSSSQELIQINRVEVELGLSEAEQGVESLFRGLPEDERLVKTMVVNPEAVSLYASLPSVKPTVTYKYVIITSSALTSAFQPLADWKISKIGSAQIVTVSWIAASYPGVDTQEKIRNFIKDAHMDWATDWVLLGGDVEVVPYRGAYGWVPSDPPTEDMNIPCDLYYSDLDGDWNADGDSIYGETSDNVDLYPDVYVARAPVNTASQATNFVDKVLTYEQNPPPGYLSNALLIAQWLDDTTNAGIGKDDLASSYLTDYTIVKVYEPYYDAGLDKTAVINHINSGQGIINHDTHANEYVAPPLDMSDVDALNNGDKTFIFYSSGCYLNAFDVSDAISEHFISNTHGGAVALIGNSRYGWYWSGHPGEGTSDKYDKEFFKQFSDGYTHIGETLARSKITFIPESGINSGPRWVQYCLNLLGDPEMDIRKAAGLTDIITVYNDGTAALTVSDIVRRYGVGEDTDWLSASPTSFSVPPGESQGVTVAVDPTGLSPNTYHGWLDIYSNDPDESPCTVTVTLTVGAPAVVHTFAELGDLFVPSGLFDALIVYGESLEHTLWGSRTIDVVGGTSIAMAFTNWACDVSPNNMLDIEVYDEVTEEFLPDFRGPLIAVGGPGVNWAWWHWNHYYYQASTESPLWAWFVYVDGHAEVWTTTGNSYVPAGGYTYAIVQLYWDPECDRPVLLVAGVSGVGSRGASEWLASKMLDDSILTDPTLKDCVAFVLKISATDYTDVTVEEYIQAS